MFNLIAQRGTSIAAQGHRVIPFSGKAGLALAALLAMGGPALKAGEGTRYGFAVSLNLPANDLKTDTNDKAGAGVAFQVTFDLGSGHAIRPRAGVNLFRVADHKQPGSDYRVGTNLVNAGIGADYLYYFNGRTSKGLYAIGGLSVEGWAVDLSHYSSSGNGTSSYSHRTTHQKNSLGVALGLGYQVNAWFGVEARYAYSQYEGAKDVPLAGNAFDAPPANRGGGSAQLVAAFRW